MSISSPWLRNTIFITLAAVLLTFIPISPIGVLGGLVLLTILPGAQLMRWLGLYQQRWDFRAVILSLALGMVTSPLLIYWSSLLIGFNRWLILIVFSLYIIGLALWVSREDQPASDTIFLIDNTRTSWVIAAILMSVAALGVFLAYFELETAQGFYPVQMEDWQKHYGVAFSLRQTGVPPTSMFFYGMFPEEPLIYYYLLHLNGATLDLLQQGQPYLHNAFVTIIVLASLCFSSVFLLLAQRLFGNQKVAVWSLAFVTVIGGLDIIPIVHRAIGKYRENFPDGPLPAGVFLPREHIDNWVSALSLRLNTFFSYHIWVPQHLTGLTILCLGVYLYLTVKARRKLLIVYPLLLFALLGHSTWVAVIVSGSLFLFALFQIATAFRVDGWQAARTIFLSYAAIATIFAIIAAPFILTLIGPDAPKSGIAFEIPKLDSWSLLRPFQANFGPAVWARLLDLPIHYFIETGLLLIAGLAGFFLFLRARGDDEQSGSPIPLPTPYALLPFWTLLMVVGLLTISFFASGRGWAELDLIQNNDLALRAFMPGQLVLALFGGYFLARLGKLFPGKVWRLIPVGAIYLLLGLGLAYTVWEFTAMGLTKYWTEPQLSPQVYQTLRTMPQVTAPQNKRFAVVQHRQHREVSRFQLSLGNRPIGFSTGEAVVFHRDVRDLALALELSERAFENGLPVWSSQMFHSLGADYVFVGPAEREAMRHPEKYQHPQYFQSVYQQDEVEIYQVKPLPFQAEPSQTTFDAGGIVFEGFFVDETPRFPGDRPISADDRGLVTAWRLTRPPDKNYTTFVHFVDSADTIIAQADHQLWAWNVRSEGPTTSWPVNLTHLDIIPLPPEVLATDEPLTIRLGLWLPDTGQQFPVEETILQVDAEGRLVIGELR
ncbi:MAG: hypothetical protein AAF485_00355 [Chloroflexota bacterium]